MSAGTLAGWFAGQEDNSSQPPPPQRDVSKAPPPPPPPPSRSMHVQKKTTTATRALTPRPPTASFPARNTWVPALAGIAPTVTRWTSASPGPANVAASKLLRAESRTNKFAAAPKPSFPTDKRRTDVAINYCLVHATDAQLRRMRTEASPGPGAHVLHDAWWALDGC
jgi:hypothetical protein